MTRNCKNDITGVVIVIENLIRGEAVAENRNL